MGEYYQIITKSEWRELYNSWNNERDDQKANELYDKHKEHINNKISELCEEVTHRIPMESLEPHAEE